MHIKNFLKFIREKAVNGSGYGCLMSKVEDQRILQKIQYIQKQLTNLHEYGIETDYHITNLFGFHDNVTPEMIEEVLKDFQFPLKATLGRIEKFSNPEFDVLKVGVKSPDLHSLNSFLREHFKDSLTITYPDYKPHMTLAYIEKGTNDSWVGEKAFDGLRLNLDHIYYSDKNNKQNRLTLSS